ncbi:hypothetical protein M9458_037080, partial [Cirrhinus mrigala]
MPSDGAGLSHGRPSIFFGAPEEDHMSIVASEEGLTPDEAGESAEQLPSVVAALSETDAELAAMLLWVAKSIGWMCARRRPPSPCSLMRPDKGLMQESPTDFALRALSGPLLRRRPLSASASLRSDPETGDPEDGRDCSSGNFDICAPTHGGGPGACTFAVPTHSQKEQFFLSLGLSPRVRVMSDALLPRTRSIHSPPPQDRDQK